MEGLDEGLVKWAVEDNACSVFEQIGQLMEGMFRGIVIICF